MKLSIIIVNWNTRELLLQCLESVNRYPPEGDYDVWVIDNASTDGSTDLLRERFPQVNLISNRENPGFARANNQGIRESAGETVLLLNPDTYVKPGALQAISRYLDASPEAGAVGPRLLNPDQSLQISCYPRPTLLREFWRMFHLDRFKPFATYPVHAWSLAQPREVDVLMGACLLIRRSVLDQVGLLDEDYFIYSEEVDLCYRIQQAGYRLYWLPQAEVVHYGGQSTQQAAEEMFLRLYQGKIVYFRKHHGRLSVQVYKLILFLATLGRLLLTPLALFERPAQRRQHLALSNHYRRLLWSLPGY